MVTNFTTILARAKVRASQAYGASDEGKQPPSRSEAPDQGACAGELVWSILVRQFSHRSSGSCQTIRSTKRWPASSIQCSARMPTGMKIKSTRLPQTTLNTISRTDSLKDGIGALHRGHLSGVILSGVVTGVRFHHLETISPIQVRTVFIAFILLVRNLASRRGECCSLLLVPAHV